MELFITGPPVVQLTLDVKRLRENLKLTGNPYKAIKSATKITKNELMDNEDELFDIVYSEVNWGTFFLIMNKYLNKKEMKLVMYPVQYNDMPLITKGKAIPEQGKFEFKDSIGEGQDYLVLGQKMMTDIDAWLDSFISGRVFDSLSNEWEIELE